MHSRSQAPRVSWTQGLEVSGSNVLGVSGSQTKVFWSQGLKVSKYRVSGNLIVSVAFCTKDKLLHLLFS